MIERVMTDKTLATLQLIAALEGGPEAYVGGKLLSTDTDLGLLNPTHARRLQQNGWLEPLRDGEPLRLTAKAREFLAGAPVSSANDSRPVDRTRRVL